VTDFIAAFIARQRTRLADPLISRSNEALALGAQLEQLEQEYQQHLEESLSTRQAAIESGYSEDNIRLLRRRRVISDRRRDLPRKPGHGVLTTPPTPISAKTPSIADRVLGRKQA